MYKRATASSRFGIVKHHVMTDPNLSVQAKALYAVLCCYANKNRLCWPSISTLADDLDSSQSSVKRWIKELKTHNFITRIGRKLTII
tara:strand:+ start:94 stop:354 length:261 start_codon:yes stop_codon:yes gene_type:complete